MNKEYIENNKEAVSKMFLLEDVYSKVKEELIECLKNGNKIIMAGNGGSAADVNHIVCEFVSRLELERKPLKAISLSSNESTFTAISNDYSFEEIYSKQLEALGDAADVFIGITTSGKSKNIINCLDVAKKKNIKTILITGSNKVNKFDYEINIPSLNTSVIQNMYMIFLHMLCMDIERYFYENRD